MIIMEKLKVTLDFDNVFVNAWAQYKKIDAGRQKKSGVDLNNDDDENTQAIKVIFAYGVQLACRLTARQMSEKIDELLKGHKIVPEESEDE